MDQRVGVRDLCEAICGLVLAIGEGRATGVRGNPDDLDRLRAQVVPTGDLPHGHGHDRESVLLGMVTPLPGASINNLTDPRGSTSPAAPHSPAACQ